MEYLCECNDMYCQLKVEIPLEKAEEIQDGDVRLTVIVDGCRHGPLHTQELVETCDGFKVYREKGTS